MCASLQHVKPRARLKSATGLRPQLPRPAASKERKLGFVKPHAGACLAHGAGLPVTPTQTKHGQDSCGGNAARRLKAQGGNGHAIACPLCHERLNLGVRWQPDALNRMLCSSKHSQPSHSCVRVAKPMRMRTSVMSCFMTHSVLTDGSPKPACVFKRGCVMSHTLDILKHMHWSNTCDGRHQTNTQDVRIHTTSMQSARTHPHKPAPAWYMRGNTSHSGEGPLPLPRTGVARDAPKRRNGNKSRRNRCINRVVARCTAQSACQTHGTTHMPPTH